MPASASSISIQPFSRCYRATPSGCLLLDLSSGSYGFENLLASVPFIFLSLASASGGKDGTLLTVLHRCAKSRAARSLSRHLLPFLARAFSSSPLQKLLLIAHRSIPVLEAYAAVVVIDSAAKKAVPLPQDEIPHVAAPAPAPQQLEAVAVGDSAAFRSSFQVRYSDMDSNRYYSCL